MVISTLDDARQFQHHHHHFTLLFVLQLAESYACFIYLYYHKYKIIDTLDTPGSTMSNRFAHHLRQQEMATRETQVSGVNTRCSPNHLRQWHNAASQASDEIPRYSCFEVVQYSAVDRSCTAPTSWRGWTRSAKSWVLGAGNAVQTSDGG